MERIEVGGGRYALVDDEDAPLVRKYEWSSFKIYNTTYAATEIDGKRVYLHRMIANAPDGMDVDHLDRDGLNNQRDNLLIRNRSGNIANARMFRHNTSGYKGVTRYKNGWRAQTKYKRNGAQRLIASNALDDPCEAAMLRDDMMRVLHGELIYLNYPDRRPTDDDLAEARRIVERTLSHPPIPRKTRP